MTADYNKSEPSNLLPVAPASDSPQKTRQLEIVSQASLPEGKRPLVLHRSDKTLQPDQKRGLKHLRLLDRTLREKLFYMPAGESRLFGQLVETQIVRYQQRNLKPACYLQTGPPSPPQSVLADRAAVHKSLEKRVERIPDEFVRSFRRRTRKLPPADGSLALLLKASSDDFKAHKAASTGNLFRLRSQPRRAFPASSLFSLTQPELLGPGPRGEPGAAFLLLKNPVEATVPRVRAAAQSRGRFVRQNIKKQREQSQNRARAQSQKQLPFLGWRQLQEQLEEAGAEDIFNGD